jgi:hypothetical protein
MSNLAKSSRGAGTPATRRWHNRIAHDLRATRSRATPIGERARINARRTHIAFLGIRTRSSVSMRRVSPRLFRLARP